MEKLVFTNLLAMDKKLLEIDFTYGNEAFFFHRLKSNGISFFIITNTF